MTSVISATVLATTLFLLFLLPGYIFLRSLWRTDRGSLNSYNLYDYIIKGALISLIFYTVAILLHNLICDRQGLTRLPFQDLCDTFADKKSSDHSANPPINPQNVDDVCYRQKRSPIFKSLDSLIAFCLLIDFFAFYLGTKIRDIIQTYDLDLKRPFFRFKSDWHYLITGRQFIFDSYGSSTIVNQHFIRIEAIVDIGKTTMLYKGILADYKLRGDTSYLCLTNVRTWHLDDKMNWMLSNGNITNNKRNNGGKYTVLKIEEIKSVNVKVVLKSW